MVKGGWAKSLTEAKEMNAPDTIQAIYYEQFLVEWDTEFMRLNEARE